MTRRWMPRALAVLCVFMVFLLVNGSVAKADLTPEHRKEAAAIKRDVAKVGSMLRRKEYSEAEAILEEAEQKLEAISTESGVKPEADRLLAGVARLIIGQRQILARMQGKGGGIDEGVSFTNDVAPIIAENCLGCHSDNPRAGLRLDTFAGMKRGGRGGTLLTVGNPARSLIMARLTAPNPNQRMPRNAEPLSREALQTIAIWIAQGAKFDGDAETTPLGVLKLKDEKPPEIAMATGNEKVSFKEDIAPFMVTHCLRCHSGANPRSGFSLETFELLMRGGDSGEVVIAGDLDGSRLWDLVGKQDPIKMPAGDGRITRENWNDLKTWIEEGAKYDGDDPQAPLRTLVPSTDEKTAEMLAKLSPEEFAERRRERTEALWKRAASSETPKTEESSEFLASGNVSQERLATISGWANAALPELKKKFDIEDSPVWKGKLAVIVFKDHFGYAEFNRSIHNREVPENTTGHSVVSDAYEDAYIAIEDVGDDENAETLTMELVVQEHLIGAILRRSDNELPEWLVRGVGLQFIARKNPQHPYVERLPAMAVAALARVQRPEDLLEPGTFSPAEVGPVGYTLVSFLLSAGTEPQMQQFVARLQQGNTLEQALRGVYRIDRAALIRAYGQKMSSVR